MSKSMWCDAVDSKPVRSNSAPSISIKILFWVIGQVEPFWGRYDYETNIWYDVNAGYFDPGQVKYFAYIDNPYK